MDLEVISSTDQKTTETLNVSDAVFARDFNEDLVHQAVVAYQAGGRAGTRAQKTRAEVTGSNAKRWRQKGTGRARVGNGKVPQWRSGGRAFPAKPRDFSQKLNRKMYRAAMQVIFSQLLRQKRLQVIDEFDVAEVKTRGVVDKLVPWAGQRVLLLTQELSEALYLSARNLHYIDICDPTYIDPVSLLAFDVVLVTKDAFKEIEEWLS